MNRAVAGVAVLSVLVVVFLLTRSQPPPLSSGPFRSAANFSAAAKSSSAEGVMAAGRMRDKRHYLSEGMTKEALNNRKGALVDYNTAIKMDPAFADAYFQRGTLKVSMKDCRGGEKDLRKAASLNATLASQIGGYLKDCR